MLKIIILLFGEFFIPPFADGFSLEFEWHQSFGDCTECTNYN